MVSWPEEYGGRGVDIERWLVFEEEYWAAGAPGRVSQNGINLLAPTLFDHATAEQRARVLPSMASGEVIWAQAWSEPESGSDLASLTSRAVRTEGVGCCPGRRPGPRGRRSRTGRSASSGPTPRPRGRTRG